MNPDNAPEGQLRARYRALTKRMRDPTGDKTFSAMLSLLEAALNLSDRQGPEKKVMLSAGTPGPNRKVVEIPLAEILGDI